MLLSALKLLVEVTSPTQVEVWKPHKKQDSFLQSGFILLEAGPYPAAPPLPLNLGSALTLLLRIN